jgi:hypothetical protein
MKTAKLFLSPLCREKSRRDGTLLTVCDSLRAMKTASFFFSPLYMEEARRDVTLFPVCFSLREILLSALALFFCTDLHAQVTIGGLENPKTGAILDLNSTARGGLLHSNVTITDPEFIPYDTNVFPGIDASGSDVNPGMCGAMVYNTGQGTTVPAGIYIWNGYCWTKDGGGTTTVTPPSISINGTVMNSYFIAEGSSVTFTVVSPQTGVSYSWYKNTSASTSGGTQVNTGLTCSTPTDLAEGTHYYYCTATSDACPSLNITSGLFTFTVNSLPLVPVGSASLLGRACFDVAQTNNGNGNGLLSVRQLATLPVPVQRADFTQLATNTQVCTFTPSSGGVNCLRFHVIEASAYSGQIIESLDYNRDMETQTNITAPQTLTVVYKNLNTVAAGKDVASALKVDIYALYSNGNGVIQAEKLTASIRDCACCGAFVGKGQWLNFSCHNLGATESANPFTPSKDIHGAKYKFGVKNATVSASEDQSNAGVINDWSSRPYQSDSQDWLPDNNPCPAG